MFRNFLIIGFVVAALSITIARGSLFFNIRVKIYRKSKFFGSLVGCTYCLSHWFAVLVILIYNPTIVQVYPVVDFVFHVFLVVGSSALITVIILSLPPFKNEDVPVLIQEKLKTYEEEAIVLRDGLSKARKLIDVLTPPTDLTKQ